MDTDEKILDLLFRRIPPERILRLICDQVRGPMALGKRDWRKSFLQFTDTTLHGYSQDEQSLFYDQLEHAVHERANELLIPDSVLLTLVDFGLEVLTTQGNEPLCRSSRVLRWRDAYHIFGQDMIVCAYLAYCDIQSQAHREDFAWPAVLRTDDGVLRQVLASGIAENHFHLNGSTQSFALAWYSLMNDPPSILRLSEDFSSLLQSVASRGPQDNVLAPKDRLVIAALTRSILFRALHRREFFTKCPSEEDSSDRGPFCALHRREFSTEKRPSEEDFCDRRSFCARDEFRRGYLHSFSPLSTVTDQIRVIRESYGVWIPLPDGEPACYDYALELPIFQAVKDSPYRVLAGERSFLYRCFTACFSGNFSDFEQDLFYLYLSLKTAFRGEMIQVNRQVGFKNFEDYQDRKDMVWVGPYRWEACRMALNAPLLTEPVRSLEARLTPSETKEAVIQKVKKYDCGKLFADQPFRPLLTPETSHFDPERNAASFLKEPYFYVLHFCKDHDEKARDLPPFSMRHRHQALREKVRIQAEALAEALSTSLYLCSRIRGIDGCANEVDCRPEVFATAFRFLRNFQNTAPCFPNPLLPHPTHRLSVTYHAGEDFYDIADGLRAIDEALYFLDYRRGDRIGHALALGVDPLTHYRTKSMSIVLPQQNYLDNLVWLLYRSRELGVSISPRQYGLMQQEALRLMRDIYGEAIGRWSVSLQDYYCSMMLRGDEPSLYQTLEFRPPPGMSGSQYDHWQIAPDQPPHALMPYRKSREIAGMYYCYHYDQEARRRGEKPIHVPIKPDYIKVVQQTQDALQRHLAMRGIIIECNPSSNVLIGTFANYASHPITRFNNMGLVQQADNPCPQMHVCVNTDDLGVFDTSLEFEYALLYRALSEQQLEDGQPLYTSKSILNYLHNLQEMGLQAAFPTPAHTGRV